MPERDTTGETTRGPWRSPRDMAPRDRLLRELARREEGMTRTQISAFFGHRLKSAEIADLLEALSNERLILGMTVRRRNQVGRPKEVWRLVAPPEA